MRNSFSIFQICVLGLGPSEQTSHMCRVGTRKALRPKTAKAPAGVKDLHCYKYFQNYMVFLTDDDCIIIELNILTQNSMTSKLNISTKIA